ncbi:hypothetical protein Y032_0001g76 [Ancylostoma ceylanicum]|uniref:BPTI/Kunitz inhibitor domain-containing protein n=1 Tax=Ancylostoma ceylanicum TaxID=53326 RepID=A0A016W6M9_9BILA|nr:hypothetical protein Y032_0001g76 [Ancylostoma ceylanicum]
MKVLLVFLFCIAICEGTSGRHRRSSERRNHSDEERCHSKIPNGEQCADEYKGFTFNINAKKCEPLTTKLCRLPLNSFDTMEECTKRCMK